MIVARIRAVATMSLLASVIGLAAVAATAGTADAPLAHQTGCNAHTCNATQISADSVDPG